MSDSIVKYDMTRRSTFKFGDGRTLTSLGVATINVKVGAIQIPVQVQIIDTGDRYVPILLGIDALRTQGWTIDFSTDEVKTIDGDVVKTTKVKTGHLMVDPVRDCLGVAGRRRE